MLSAIPASFRCEIDPAPVRGAGSAAADGGSSALMVSAILARTGREAGSVQPLGVDRQIQGPPPLPCAAGSTWARRTPRTNIHLPTAWGLKRSLQTV